MRVDLAHIPAEHSALLESDEGCAEARRISETTRELRRTRERWKESLVLKGVCCDGGSSETPEDSKLEVIAIGRLGQSREKVARTFEVPERLGAARQTARSQTSEVVVVDRLREALTCVKVCRELRGDRVRDTPEPGLESLCDPAMPEARDRGRVPVVRRVLIEGMDERVSRLQRAVGPRLGADIAKEPPVFREALAARLDVIDGKLERVCDGATGEFCAGCAGSFEDALIAGREPVDLDIDELPDAIRLVRPNVSLGRSELPGAVDQPDHLPALEVIEE